VIGDAEFSLNQSETTVAETPPNPGNFATIRPSSKPARRWISAD